MASEEMSFENVDDDDGRTTTDGRRMPGYTISHLWAFGSGELKNKTTYVKKIQETEFTTLKALIHDTTFVIYFMKYTSSWTMYRMLKLCYIQLFEAIYNSV